MKELVAIGVCLLLVIGGVNSTTEGKHCCGKDNEFPPEAAVICEGLKDRVQNKVLKYTKDIEKIPHLDGEISKDLELQIKVNAFAKAALECVPNNRAYRNVHLTFDKIHNTIAKFFTQRNIRKKITELQDNMDEEFDSLAAAQPALGPTFPNELSTRIDKFIEEKAEKATKVFGINFDKAKFNEKAFVEIPLMDLIDKIVDKMDQCLEIKQTDVGGLFACRQEVRKLAKELNYNVEFLAPMGSMDGYSDKPDMSLDKLMLDFTAGAKELEWMISEVKKRKDFQETFKEFRQP